MKYRLSILKKYNRIALTFVMLAVLFGTSLPAYAAEGGSCGSSLQWDLSDGVLNITGKGDMDDYRDGNIAPWHEMAEKIVVVNLSSGVTSVGDYAFAECTNLLQVNLGNVTSIGDGAFYQCESLSSVSFPSSVTSIGSKAFYRCYGLKTVTLPSSVADLGSAAFGYCEGLVRAIVNAPLDSLPVWTFYGCSNLTDVSLAPQITSVGEYAFGHCDNLHGIYLQSGDDQVAAEMEKTVEDSFVATHEMPNSSTAINDNGDYYTAVTVTQSGNVPVSVTDIVDNTREESTQSRLIEAMVHNPEEWASVAKIVQDEINSGKPGGITVQIQLIESKITAEELAQYAGKSITLHLKLTNGVIWKLDMSKFSEDDFSGTYELGVTVEKTDSSKTTISSENVYAMRFASNVDFNVTVGLNLGKQYDKATLFVKDNSEYNLINTMIVDYNNYAWFSLAGVSKGTKYYVGINVDKIKTEDATIPETMYAEYGLEEDGSYLMDSEGMQYRITGRTSRWGITGKQFAMYVGAAIGGTVLIVGSIMLTFYIIKKSREKYERMAEEEALREKEEEEALRMEIMKELLGESDRKIE